MSTDRQRETANKLQEFAKFLREEYLDPNSFEGWPGLPQPGETPSFDDATLFLIGCCINLQEYAWRAWQKADNFCKGTVPKRDRNRIWHWIANHPLKEWKSHKRRKGMKANQLANTYDLHWLDREHERIHRIATSLVKNYWEDPKRIWSNCPGSAVLGILKEELGLGDGIARMIVGALRDHNIRRRRPTKTRTASSRASVRAPVGRRTPSMSGHEGGGPMTMKLQMSL